MGDREKYSFKLLDLYSSPEIGKEGLLSNSEDEFRREGWISRNFEG